LAEWPKEAVPLIGRSIGLLLADCNLANRFYESPCPTTEHVTFVMVFGWLSVRNNSTTPSLWIWASFSFDCVKSSPADANQGQIMVTITF
jgi:hypothetical protein